MRKFLCLLAGLFLCLPVSGSAQFHFAPPVYLPARKQPFYIVTGDFNQDGHLDLAVCNRTSNDVSVFFGNGEGGFPSRTDYLLGEEDHRPVGLTAADLNRDGALDLAVANQETNSVSILYGDGEGGFTGPAEFPTGSPKPEAVVAADFNRDGLPDLAVANRAGHEVHTGDVTILQQTAAGAFIELPAHLPGRAPRSLLAADLTGDGNPDLVSANFLTPSIFVFTSKGDGTFQDPIQLESGLGPVHIVGANLNGDNALDLVIANRRSPAGQPGLSVYLGAFGGSFHDPVYLNAGELPAAVAATDLTGDGHCDIALVNGFTDDLMLYRGNGLGELTGPTTIFFESSITPRSLVAADLDHDGDQDLVVAHKDNNTLAALLNQAANPVGIAVTAASATPRISGVIEIVWEIVASGVEVSLYRQPGNVYTAGILEEERTRLTAAAATRLGKHRYIDHDVRIGQTYTYWLEAAEADGGRQTVGPLIVTLDPPEQYELAQNAPNPFNASTTITYHLARAGHTTLILYNLLGERVATLVDAGQAPGIYNVRWNGRDDLGTPVGSGVYIYTLRAGAFTATRRMMLLK